MNLYIRESAMRKCRKKKGYTICQVAEITGISKTRISDLENGLTKPHDNEINIMTDIYKVKTNDLLGY